MASLNFPFHIKNNCFIIIVGGGGGCKYTQFFLFIYNGVILIDKKLRDHVEFIQAGAVISRVVVSLCLLVIHIFSVSFNKTSGTDISLLIIK